MNVKNHFISNLIYAALKDSTDAGSRVYPHFVVGDTLPNIVFKRAEFFTQEYKFDYFIESTLAVNVCAKGYDECCAITEQAITAMLGIQDERIISVELVSGTEGSVEEEEWFTIEVIFKLKHN